MSKRLTKNESAQTKGEVVANCDHLGLTQSVTRIEDYIHVFRGKQVMLDRDLAALYQVETKVLNQAVKRNSSRFPEDFMFQLSKDEFEKWKSQFVTSNSIKMGARKRPYAFSENGIAMLSSVLRSETAIQMNISIMRAFNQMRHFINSNAQVFQRLETIEYHQLEMERHLDETDRRVDSVLNLMTETYAKPKQGIFFDQQIYDAYDFVSGLIKQAKKRIILIDNYVDESILTMLDKREVKVSATIYTAKIDKQLQLDITKHNAQYPAIDVKIFSKSHDRFLCIDSTVYHIGASIKDLGKKWFAFSILHDTKPEDLVKRIMGK